MLSIQEMVNKCEPQIRNIKKQLGKAIFHPEEASIFTNQKQSDYFALKETLNNISLSEFLAKSGVAGISGAIYMIPDKLYDTVIFSSARTDYTPLISAYMAERWEGGTLKVPVASKTYYAPQPFSSGGRKPDTESKVASVSLNLTNFRVAPHIGNDMIEDNAYDLIQYLIEKAGQSLGEYATNLALTALKTAEDGWGTVNGGLSGNADETMWTGAATTDIEDCLAALSDDHWLPDTMITTTEAWENSIKTTLNTLASNIPLEHQLSQPAQGFHAKIGLHP